ncbi:hypothetical protein SAMN05216188_102803 [Lentzea xinjiangensis]|uniref:Uncharacterized protein n=1 Tax=Lentzea xinjiangensis TaxID=402600 RepID=A0A1H9F6E5_9PSEU|nr:hypothetical protein SAMN05216188_102803 [Lentzea xinjiangensis]
MSLIATVCRLIIAQTLMQFAAGKRWPFPSGLIESSFA